MQLLQHHSTGLECAFEEISQLLPLTVLWFVLLRGLMGTQSGWSGNPWGQSKGQQLKCITCKCWLLHTDCLSVQIHSLLHTICYHTCSSMCQLGIPHHFWVSWVPKAETACGPFHKMHFSRLKVQSNYSLSLRRLWIEKCWAQLVTEQNDWSDRCFSSAIKRGHSDLILF